MSNEAQHRHTLISCPAEEEETRVSTFQTKHLLSPANVIRLEETLELRSVAGAIVPAVKHICSILIGFVDNREIKRIELALNEVIRNAYEHGSLGLTSDDKSHHCNAGTLEQELDRREQLCEYSSKRIRINYSVTPTSFTCTVEDEGRGFDWQEWIRSYTHDDRIASADELNGRGIFLISKTFDEIAFNDRGNRVQLAKRLG